MIAEPTGEIQDPEPDPQAVAVLIEKLKAAGHSVHADKAGGFTVSKWNMSRHCFDDLSLGDFARQVGAL